MYFAFPGEHTSSLSTLTSLMVTTEEERKRLREIKVKKRERDAMRQSQGEKNKEDIGEKMRAMGQCGQETIGHTLLKSIYYTCFSIVT